MQVLPGIVKNFSNIAFHPSNIRQTIILSTSKEEKSTHLVLPSEVFHILGFLEMPLPAWSVWNEM